MATSATAGRQSGSEPPEAERGVVVGVGCEQQKGGGIAHSQLNAKRAACLSTASDAYSQMATGLAVRRSRGRETLASSERMEVARIQACTEGEVANVQSCCEAVHKEIRALTGKG